MQNKADDIYIVSEMVDGEKVETPLPREQAQKLFRKVRTVNDSAWIRKESLEQVEKPYISGFEVEA